MIIESIKVVERIERTYLPHKVIAEAEYPTVEDARRYIVAAAQEQYRNGNDSNVSASITEKLRGYAGKQRHFFVVGGI